MKNLSPAVVQHCQGTLLALFVSGKKRSNRSGDRNGGIRNWLTEVEQNDDRAGIRRRDRDQPVVESLVGNRGALLADLDGVRGAADPCVGQRRKQLLNCSN